jgi:FK506-binding protein 2
MRTLELRDPNSDLQNMVIGLWAAPEHMPQIAMDALRGTLDLELTASGDGWAGETPYPYPNASQGAVEMTSGITISADRLETTDRGYDADGNVVWGTDEGESYVFERTEPYFVVERGDLGLVTISLRDDATEEPFADGDAVAFQYTGWISAGTMFDTSRRQGKRPLQYQAPEPPSGLIEGWKLGVAGMSKGDWRKFIVPAQLGYGPSGAGGGMIPPNSDLIFEAELVYVQPPAPPEPADADPDNGGGE